MENLNFFLQHPPTWTNAIGTEAEIVLSSRTRLIRNLQQFKFPHKESQETRNKIVNFISPYIEGKKFTLSQLGSIEKELLTERHIVTRKFVEEDDGKGLCIQNGEDVVYIINKEDHVRISCTLSGLNIQQAYQKINKEEEILSKKVKFAFSKHFGYLTACPINIGTGLRASVFLHLPGLVHSGKLIHIRDKIIHSGLFVRGVYGEGTTIEGNIFQVATQITLGKTEETIVEELEKMTNELIEYEKSARELLLKDTRLILEDKIWRAHAILKNACLLSFEEFINLSSAIRMGIGIGMIKSVKLKTLNELLIFSRSAHLQKLTGRIMQPEEIAVRRAMYVAQQLE